MVEQGQRESSSQRRVTCLEGGKWHKTILNCPAGVGYVQECLECGKEFGRTYERVVYPEGIIEA